MQILGNVGWLSTLALSEHYPTLQQVPLENRDFLFKYLRGAASGKRVWREWSDPAPTCKDTTETSFKNKNLGMGILILLLSEEVLEILRYEAGEQPSDLECPSTGKGSGIHSAADQVIPDRKESNSTGQLPLVLGKHIPCELKKFISPTPHELTWIEKDPNI